MSPTHHSSTAPGQGLSWPALATPRHRGLHLYLLPIISFAASLFAQTPRFRANVNLINTTFSVRNGQGKLVGDLNQNEVEVLEDGVPQKISFFARTSDLPLTIGLIVDASDSQSKFFHRHHRDVETFLKDVLGPQDEAFLVCFGNHLRLVSDRTASVPQVINNLKEYEHDKGHFPELGPKEKRTEGTAFYDAIFYAAQEKLANAHGRRALVVFSDGEDNASAHDLIDAIEALQSADVLAYDVRYTDAGSQLTARNKYGIRVMQRISHDSGALDFDARQGELDQTFRDIGAELHALYEVGYYSRNPLRDGTFHKVVVRTTRSGLVTRAKPGYFAEK